MNEVIREDINSILESRQDLERFRNSTFLISGANSFMMSYLIFLLLECNRRKNMGIKIAALCRSKERAKERFLEYWGDAGLSVILQDICRETAYDGEIDYCIHAASPAGIASRQEYPAETFLVNLQGCKNLLDLCLPKKLKKFMLLSSVDVYGTGLKSDRLKETDTGLLDWNYQRCAYASGKRAAESLCSLYYAQYQTPCVIARPFQVYGPGMSLIDGRLHGDFIRQLLESGKIVLKSDGTARRSFLYLADAVNAMLDLLLYGVNGEIYNICDEAGECSVQELAELYAARADGKIEFIYEKRNTPEVKEALPVVLGDSKKLRGLGWRRETSLTEGIDRTWRHYVGERTGYKLPYWKVRFL